MKKIFPKFWKFIEDIRRSPIEHRAIIYFTAAIAGFTLILALVSIWQIAEYKKSVEIENRAYLAIDDMQPDTLIAGRTVKVQIHIKNMGKTPAYKVTDVAGFAIRDSLSKKQIDTVKYPLVESDVTVGTSVGYWFQIESPPGFLREQLPSLIYNQRKKLVVFGQILYRDTFGEQHFIHYAVFLDPAFSPPQYRTMPFYNDSD